MASFESAVKKHPLSHGYEGTTAPSGTNQGRVDVPIRGPGELSDGYPGVMKGKAVIGHGFPVNLAGQQDQMEGGYRAGSASAGGPGKP